MFGFKRKSKTLRQQNSETAAYLGGLEGVRASAQSTMGDEQFYRLRDGIELILQAHRPSHHNGKLPKMLIAINDFLVSNKVNPEAYWTEVWLRSGRKDLGNYNKK